MAQQVSNTSKVVKGMSSQTLVTAMLGVVEIVSFSIMSRLLSKEDFGYYAAIMGITAIFAVFTETGIGSAIVQQKDLSKRYINNAFTLSLLFGCIISLLMMVLAGPVARIVADESMKVPLMLISGTLLLNCMTSVNNSIMHRKLQFMRMGLIQLFSLIITTCVGIWLAYKGYGYYAILTKGILFSILRFILSFIMCNTRYGFALDGQIVKKIFSFTGWLMASSIFRSLSHQIERLMMPRLLSVASLGAYNRPKEFVEQISNKLNGIFDSAMFPVLSGIQDNRAAINSAFRRSLFLMNVFALWLTLAFVFNSELLIRIFFGQQWLNLQNVMVAISCTLLFNIDGRLADCYLRSMAMTRQQFFFRIFEFVLKALGIIIGVRWDILGVAISIAITNLISKLFKIIYIGGKVDVKPKQTINLIISSWRYSILMLPICIVSYFLLPDTLGGDIAMASIFIMATAIVFLFMPRFVGEQYQQEVYSKIIPAIKNKLHKK